MPGPAPRRLLPRGPWRWPALLLVAAAFPGCGYGLLQSPRTTPPGDVDLTFGGTLIANTSTEEVTGLEVLPAAALQSRWGLTESLDLGVGLFNLLGASADLRWGLFARARPYALVASGGLGGTWKTNVRDDEDGRTLFARVGVLGGYDLLRGAGGKAAITGMVGVSFADFLFFGVPRPDTDSPDPEVAGTGRGDGVVMLHTGLLFADGLVGVEYSYWTVVFDDPADHFRFVDNHVVSLSVRWGI